MSANSGPLRDPTIEGKPKRVLVSSIFRDYTGRAGEEPFQSDLLEIRRRISQGLDLLPAHYRKDRLTTPDYVLERFGFKHLHLGGQSSDVLLFLAEFDDCVVLAEINSHIRFRDDPPGKNLAATHSPAVTASAERQAEESTRSAARADRLKAARERARAVRAKKP